MKKTKIFDISIAPTKEYSYFSKWTDGSLYSHDALGTMADGAVNQVMHFISRDSKEIVATSDRMKNPSTPQIPREFIKMYVELCGKFEPISSVALEVDEKDGNFTLVLDNAGFVVVAKRYAVEIKVVDQFTGKHADLYADSDKPENLARFSNNMVKASCMMVNMESEDLKELAGVLKENFDKNK